MTSTLPTPRKLYVRTFLFAMRLDSPLGQLHVGTKVALVLVLSVVVIRMIGVANPDPVGAFVLMVLTLAGLLLSGVGRYLIRSYLVVLYPMLLTLFFTWLIFNPDPGSQVLYRGQLYSGAITVSLSAYTALLAVVAGAFWLRRRRLLTGLLLGWLLAFAGSRLFPVPQWSVTQVAFYRPLLLLVSDATLTVAATKVLGYAALVFASLMLVMTTRDIELTGGLRQLRVPFSGVFYLSIMLRSLSIAIMDYGTIRHAQIARGINLRNRGMLERLRDVAQISVPLIATMIRRAAEVGDAAMARGLVHLHHRPTDFEETRPFRPADYAILAVLLALLAANLVASPNLTRMLGLLEGVYAGWKA